MPENLIVCTVLEFYGGGAKKKSRQRKNSCSAWKPSWCDWRHHYFSPLSRLFCPLLSRKREKASVKLLSRQWGRQRRRSPRAQTPVLNLCDLFVDCCIWIWKRAPPCIFLLSSSRLDWNQTTPTQRKNNISSFGPPCVVCASKNHNALGAFLFHSITPGMGWLGENTLWFQLFNEFVFNLCASQSRAVAASLYRLCKTKVQNEETESSDGFSLLFLPCY